MARQIFRNVAAGLKSERMSFADFYPQAWRQLEPSTPFVDNWHYGLIGEHLEAVLLGQITRLIINSPPRTWKSGEIEIAFGAWVWTQRPWMRFIFGAYAHELALAHSVHRRGLIQSPWYQEKWGKVFTMAEDQNQKGQYENSALGTMYSTSMGGTIVGFGANILVIGDWMNPKLAESAAHRAQAHYSYDNAVRNRLNDPKRDAIIIAEQRMHADDLTGHVENQENWTKLDLPALFKKRRVYSFPISRDADDKPLEIVCEEGSVLQPSRFPFEVLEATRKASGTRTFNAQQLQNPDDAHGTIVDKFWWRFYDEDPLEIAKKASFLGQSWDMAFVKTTTSSFVVGLIGAIRGAFRDILAESRDQRNYPETKKEVRRFSADWPTAYHKWVENKANGPAIVDDLQVDQPNDPAIPGVISVPTGLGDKTARMVRVSAKIETGHVRLPNPYLRDKNGFRPDRYDPAWNVPGRINPRFAWVIDYIEELAIFPKEPNDRGDATSQLIVMLDGVPLDQYVDAKPEPEEAGNIFGNGAAADPFGNLQPFGHPAHEQDEADIFHDGRSIFDV